MAKWPVKHRPECEKYRLNPIAIDVDCEPPLGERMEELYFQFKTSLRANHYSSVLGYDASRVTHTLRGDFPTVCGGRHQRFAADGGPNPCNKDLP